MVFKNGRKIRTLLFPLLLAVSSFTQIDVYGQSSSDDYLECYGEIRKIVKEHLYAEVVCSCLITVGANTNPAIESQAADYCVAKAREIVSSRDQARFIEIMRLRESIIRGSSVSGSSMGGGDATCALTRAFGMSCAGDRTVRCRNVTDFLGNVSTVCQ